MADPTASPVCVNCRVELGGPYCHLCGEKRIGPRELSFRHYLEALVEAIFNVEGKLLKSFRTLIARPGLLTAEYWRGRRICYMRPLSLFLDLLQRARARVHRFRRQAGPC